MFEQEQISKQELTEEAESFFASPFAPVKFWSSVLLERKDGLPIVFHADHRPVILLRFGHERVTERADLRLCAVGKLAHRVIVMHEHHQARAVASLRPLQHLLIAVRVAERGDGTAADVRVDTDWFAGLVVDEVHFRQPHEYRLAIAHFILRLDAAAYDLLRRDAVNLVRPRTHKLDAAAGNDEGLETVCAQISEQFDHRLIHALALDEGDDCLLRRSVVPRREGISGPRY